MELIVFDLDGTLLDGSSTISDYTRETLAALAGRGIAYTVATGRTLHASQALLAGHGFGLPQIYKNGVMIWHPSTEHYSHRNCLTMDEVDHVLHAMLAQEVTPFVFTVEPGNRHAIYHPPVRNEVEEKLAAAFARYGGVAVLPASRLPADAEITNLSAIGSAAAIQAVRGLVDDEAHLVAYSGGAWEGEGQCWIDIHHTEASKGSAVEELRGQLGVQKVICFGDGDNDLSMFATADECYAPENASAEVRAAATAVIGRHDADGVAQFLRERFRLDA